MIVLDRRTGNHSTRRALEGLLGCSQVKRQAGPPGDVILGPDRYLTMKVMYSITLREVIRGG